MTTRELAKRWMHSHVFQAHGITGSLYEAAEGQEFGSGGLCVASLFVEAVRDGEVLFFNDYTIRGYTWTHLLAQVRRLLPELTCARDLSLLDEEWRELETELRD